MMKNSFILIFLFLGLQITIGFPVKTPPESIPASTVHWDDFEDILDIQKFDPNYKTTQIQIQEPTAIQQQIKTKRKYQRRKGKNGEENKKRIRKKTKAEIERQTKNRAEKKRTDIEYRTRVKEQLNKSYLKKKNKFYENLTEEEIKNHFKKMNNERKQKYNGFTSSKEQRFYETKLKLQNGLQVTEEEKEFVIQELQRRAKYQREYQQRKKSKSKV